MAWITAVFPLLAKRAGKGARVPTRLIIYGIDAFADHIRHLRRRRDVLIGRPWRGVRVFGCDGVFGGRA